MTADREALVKALNNLDGAFEAFEHEIRSAIGNTNYTVIVEHARAARAALAETPPVNADLTKAREALRRIENGHYGPDDIEAIEEALAASPLLNEPARDIDDCPGGYRWNPLTDDGDALRLAVKRRFHVCVFSAMEGGGIKSPGFVEVWQEGDSDPLTVERVVDGDYEATTRRAIVRAAAVIGSKL